MRSRSNRFPYAVALLIAANVVAFLYTALNDPAAAGSGLYVRMSTLGLYRFGGLMARSVVAGGEFYRLFSSMFLHVDIPHLFNNMLLLAFLGKTIEKEHGFLVFLIVYFASGLSGNAATAYFYNRYEPFTVSVGASGAVFGLVGACLLLILFHGGNYRGISLKRVMILIIYNLGYGLSNGTVNNTAHIAGLIAGFVCMLPFVLLRRNPAEPQKEIR